MPAELPDAPTTDTPLSLDLTALRLGDNGESTVKGVAGSPFGLKGDLTAGAVLVGRYRLDEELARGGMGVVYRATDLAFGRPVAVKMIQTRHLHSQALRRFAEESQITGQLQHPGIPPVHELGTLPDGRPYLVMKLIKGRTLTEMLQGERQSGGPTWTASSFRFLAVFEQVCQTVAYAHSRGVIHRDLKPSNVMVGAFGETQVMDWGLAKLVNRDARYPERSADAGAERIQATALSDPRADSDSSGTHAGTVLGTLSYMPPEQAAGVIGLLDQCADVFGLGAILCTLLTGKPPYQGDSIDAIRLKASLGDLAEAFVRLDGSGAQPELIALAKRCLAAKAEERPKDAGEVAAAVAAFRTQAEERARLAELERVRADGDRQKAELRAKEEHKRRRVQMALATAMLVGMVVSAGMAAWAWAAEKQTRGERDAKEVALGQATRERDDKERERQRAAEAEADTKAFAAFLTDRVLAAARPEGVKGGLGINVSLIVALEKAEESLTEEFAGRPKAEATARHALGQTWAELSADRYPRAEAHFRRAIELRTKELGPEHPETLDSSNSLGNLLGRMGRHDERTKMLERIRTARTKVLGADHPSTFKTLNNLAAAYFAAGRLDDAIRLLESFRAAQAAKIGSEHEDSLSTHNTLAAAYQSSGRLDKAIPLFEQVHEAFVKTRGADNPSTLTIRGNLAWAYLLDGKAKKAIPLLEQVRTARAQKLGPEHPLTLNAMNKLACAYQNDKQLDRAIRLFEQALEVQTKNSGADHPESLTTLSNLAQANLDAGKLDRAITLFEQAHSAQRRKLGPDHPETLRTANNLAWAYRDAGQFERAVPLFQQAAAAVEKNGFRRQDASGIIDSLCECLEKRSDFAAAEAWRRKWLKAAQENHGADSLAHAQALAGVAHNLLLQKRFPEAETLLRESVPLAEKKEPDYWTTFGMKSALGATLLGQKKLAEAEPHLRAGYEGMKLRADRIPAQEHDRLLEAGERLSQLHEAAGRPAEAAALRAEVEALKKKLGGVKGA